VNINTQQNVVAQGVQVLRAECDPSLKSAFVGRIKESGFASEADTIRTLARDFGSGRIKYKGGMLQSQAQN